MLTGFLQSSCFYKNTFLIRNEFRGIFAFKYLKVILSSSRKFLRLCFLHHSSWKVKQKHLLNLTMIPLAFEQWFKSKLKQTKRKRKSHGPLLTEYHIAFSSLVCLFMIAMKCSARGTPLLNSHSLGLVTCLSLP